MTSHRDDDFDSLVEGRQQSRLPAAARQAGHPDALGIGLGVSEQYIEAAFHQEVEHADAGDAAQVEVADAVCSTSARNSPIPRNSVLSASIPRLARLMQRACL